MKIFMPKMHPLLAHSRFIGPRREVKDGHWVFKGSRIFLPKANFSEARLIWTEGLFALSEPLFDLFHDDFPSIGYIRSSFEQPNREERAIGAKLLSDRRLQRLRQLPPYYLITPASSESPNYKNSSIEINEIGSTLWRGWETWEEAYSSSGDLVGAHKIPRKVGEGVILDSNPKEALFLLKGRAETFCTEVAVQWFEGHGVLEFDAVEVGEVALSEEPSCR